MSVTNGLIKTTQSAPPAAATTPAHKGGWMQPSTLDEAWRLAESIACSPFMPEALCVKGNARATTYNMLAVMQIAESLSVPAITLLQNTHVIHGKVGYSSSFLLAMANKSGLFRGPVEFDVKGRDSKDWPRSMSVRAWAVRADTGEKVYGPEVTYAMAEAEGWATKAGSKWKTMPELMGTYRAGTMFVRTKCPQVLHGVAMQTTDELEDIAPMHVESVPALPESSAVDRARAAGVAATATVDAVEVDETPRTEGELRKALARKLAADVEQGADESFVRAACEESGICSDEFVEKLCAKLFPREAQP